MTGKARGKEEVFMSHIIAPRHMIDSKIMSNRGNHINLAAQPFAR